jgi:hypothetical protein
MRRTAKYLAIPIIAALVITGATYVVGEFVTASVPGGHGLGGSAVIYGFPIPFVTVFPCCGGGGASGYSVSLNNTSFYHPLNFLADFTVWLAISLGIASTFTTKRFLAAIPSGVIVTLATLFLPPLSIAVPTPGAETAVLRPMGFPYEYLTYYVAGLPGIKNPSGYSFYLSPALADYVLWTGVAFAVIGVTLTAIRRTRSGPPSPSLGAPKEPLTLP